MDDFKPELMKALLDWVRAAQGHQYLYIPADCSRSRSIPSTYLAESLRGASSKTAKYSGRSSPISMPSISTNPSPTSKIATADSLIIGYQDGRISSTSSELCRRTYERSASSYQS